MPPLDPVDLLRFCVPRNDFTIKDVIDKLGEQQRSAEDCAELYFVRADIADYAAYEMDYTDQTTREAFMEADLETSDIRSDFMDAVTEVELMKAYRRNVERLLDRLIAARRIVQKADISHFAVLNPVDPSTSPRQFTKPPVPVQV